MKNKLSSIVVVMILFSLSPLTLSAQASFGGSATVSEPGTSNTSQASFGGVATWTPTPSTPSCLQEIPGWYYATTPSQCQCPNGTTVWSSNGRYTSQCQWGNTCTGSNCYPSSGIPTCIESYSFFVGSGTQCRCPNGQVVLSNSGYVTYQCRQYTPPQTTQVCWDGSVIASNLSCPAYKYCSNDSYTKRSANYTCPSTTKTCPNGTVVSIYQECPQTTSYCNFSGSGWCSQNDSPKVFEWPVVDPNSSAWNWQNNNYSSYSPSYTNNNVNYSVGWRPL